MKFLLGMALGSFVGILLAPESGERTRAKLADKARELSEVPAQKVAEAARASKEKAGEVGARVGRQAAEAAVQAAADELTGKHKESA